jgi:hypothetical protein
MSSRLRWFCAPGLMSVEWAQCEIETQLVVLSKMMGVVLRCELSKYSTHCKTCTSHFILIIMQAEIDVEDILKEVER